MSRSALVFGVLTSVGVELVRVLLDSGIFSHIRAVDKSLPELAFITDDYKEYLARTEYMQANTLVPDVVCKCFDRDDGRQFDYVFNCAVECKLDSVDEYYHTYLYQRSVNVATEAAKRGIKVFVQQGYGHDYKDKPGYAANVETDELIERTPFSKYRVLTDKALRDIPGLNLVLVRTALLYGPTDTGGMGSGLVTLYLTWRADVVMPIAIDPALPRQTLHTVDAARAMLHLAEWYVNNGKTGVEIVNVGDAIGKTMGEYPPIFAQLFPYKYQFVVPPNQEPSEEEQEAMREELNEICMDAWMDVVTECGIERTPISPYVYKELYSTYPIGLDVTKLRSTGFEWKYPEYTKETGRHTVEHYTKLGLWPTATGPLPTSDETSGSEQ